MGGSSRNSSLARDGRNRGARNRSGRRCARGAASGRARPHRPKDLQRDGAGREHAQHHRPKQNQAAVTGDK
ncbi:MAG: hypothetical protein WDN04_12315 [Rhodospirillales bacterium]